MAESSSPTEIDGFKVLRELGRGGMGQVFEVEKDGRVFALKVLRSSDPELQLRFLREAQAQARVQHNLVARIHSSGQSKLGSYILMERLAGPDLAAWIQSRGPCDWPEAKAILISLCSALHAIHEAGLIHRDLKTSNVLFRSPGEPVICDFGLVRIGDAESLTASGISLGTPYSMAPEQIQGLKIDARVDIWALGVLAYELLTAQRPFQGVNLQKLSLAICVGDYRSIEDAGASSELSSQASRFIERCLQVSPDDRFDSASAASDALKNEETPYRSRASHKLTLASMGLVIATVLGFSYQFIPKSTPNPAPPPPLPSAPWPSLETAAKAILAEQLLSATILAMEQRPGSLSSAPAAQKKPVIALPAKWEHIDLSNCPPRYPNLALLAFLHSPEIQFSDPNTAQCELVQVWRGIIFEPRPFNPELIGRLSKFIKQVQIQSASSTYDSALAFLKTLLLEDSGQLQSAAQQIIKLESQVENEASLQAEIKFAIKTRRRQLWTDAVINALSQANQFSNSLELLRGRPLDAESFDSVNDALRRFFSPTSKVPVHDRTRAMRELFEASLRHDWLTIPPAP